MKSSSLSASPAIAIHYPLREELPVIVSVPHAGRVYPHEIMSHARVTQDDLERLEDGWCDQIAKPAVSIGATMICALWARAVADCNRAEGQMAPSEVAPSIRHQFSAPGRKERAGLGVVPTRLFDIGPLWAKPIDAAGLNWRLDQLHRPYHAALTDALDRTCARFGRAILIDLHSMPPLPVGQPGHGAKIVVGDRFGSSSAAWIIEPTLAAAQQLGERISRNQPYAGGHITQAHGNPGRSIHAIQIELDRSLYLNVDGSANSDQVLRLSNWFLSVVCAAAAARPDDQLKLLAAE
jgi:N-formylglutamate amidohydrolase